MSDKGETLVIDIGSLNTKTGLGGDEEPTKVLPTVANRIDGKKYTGYFAIAECKTRLLKQNKPVERGEFRDIEGVCDILSEEIEYFKYQGADTVLITESSLQRYYRERIAEEVFSSERISKISFVNQGVLSLLASGRTTGVAVDIGDGVTEVIPVYEGCPIRHSILTQNFGGKDITEFLNHSLFIQEKHKFISVPPHHVIRRIKEERCYVSLNFEIEDLKASHKIFGYKLADGTYINLRDEVFKCPEALFQPDIWEKGKKLLGIHKLCHEAIQKCDPELRKELYGNIITSGGSTMFKGFEERMEKEMRSSAPHGVVKVTAAPRREYSAWLGGSILTSNPAFDAMCLTREEFEERGRFCPVKWLFL